MLWEREAMFGMGYLDQIAVSFGFESMSAMESAYEASSSFALGATVSAVPEPAGLAGLLVTAATFLFRRRK
jgi:hypothetical protein